MTSARKTWVSILIALVIVVGVLGIAFVGGTTFFVYRHTSARFVAPAAAADEFAQARARFTGQTPLLELVTGDGKRTRNDKGGATPETDDYGGVGLVVHRTLTGERRQINALHVLTYQAATGKIVRVDIPGWLLQLSSVGGHFRLANLDAIQGDNEKVTIEDLERHGPGLILDMSGRRGTQVLIWTE